MSNPAYGRIPAQAWRTSAASESFGAEGSEMARGGYAPEELRVQGCSGEKISPSHREHYRI